LAGFALAIFSATALFGQETVCFDLSSALSSGFAPFEPPRFLVDALSAFFCLILSIVTVAISIYSIQYSRHYAQEPCGLLAGFFALTTLSILLVLTADGSFQFLFSWELMSLFACFLVAFENRKEQSVRAAGIYVAMTHFGTIFLLAMFLLISSYSGSSYISEASRAFEAFPKGVLNFIFVAALIGFGTKAGLVPLHAWLPVAHPAAPTNISALMSGMMVKAGIYGIARIFLVFNQGIETWWALALLGIASASALVGVMYALMETDLKRMLAFSTVENAGIILIGIAMSMLFWRFHMPALAGFALTAALFHAFNHAIFKTLLFLAAGNLQTALHSRDIEKMGGLIRVMPWTAIAFLAGALSISAVLPLNGFVSEWMTFVSIFQVYVLDAAPEAVRLGVTLAAAALALTGALAAACFVRAFGIAFLGLPRSEAASVASEAPWLMRLPQLFLAFLCAGLGLFPFLAIHATEGVRRAFFGAEAALPIEYDRLSAPAGTGSISTVYAAAALLGCAALALAAARAFRRPGARSRMDITWACGGVAGGRQQYSATGFSKPVRRIFSAFYRPRREILVDIGENPYHVKSTLFRGEVEDVFELKLYRPLARLAQNLSARLLALQETSVNAYLGYILVLVVALLLLGGS
jgi:hydrogenase-4 component B